MINKSSILNRATNFFSRIFQNYIVFTPAKELGTTRIDFRSPNRMSEENIKNITKSESNFAWTFVDHHLLPDINFKGYCLINNICFSKKVISYTPDQWSRSLNPDFTLNHCFLFVNATKMYQFKVKISEIKIVHFVHLIFQRILQVTIWKSRIKRNCNIFSCWF